MHVLINAASAHMGGALTYIQNLLRCLPEVAPADRFTVVLPGATREKVGPLARENVRLVDYPGRETGGVGRLWFDQIDVPRLVRDLDVDLLFSSTGFGSPLAPCPEVLLVRNPVYFNRAFQEKYRELGRSFWRNRLRRWYSLFTMKGADVVLFPTRAMQRMVEPYIDFSNVRTDAVHYGFDRDRFFADETDPPAIEPRIRRWRAEGKNILLSVSTYAVHKNFETLIEALPHLKRSGRSFRLVTTTSRARTTDEDEYDALRRRAETLGVEECWVESGYIPYDRLQFLYRQADAYVFPSFTESFGHSLVEAMAAGCPVIAADTEVNREVCGAAGAFFETFNPVACARSIARVLSDERHRLTLARASSDRAPHFSWRDYTERLVTIFRRTLDGDAPSRRRQSVAG